MTTSRPDRPRPWRGCWRVRTASRRWRPRGHLSPWTTWPTLHRGVNDEQHLIASFGQDRRHADRRFPPVWSLLHGAGVSSRTARAPPPTTFQRGSWRSTTRSARRPATAHAPRSMSWRSRRPCPRPWASSRRPTWHDPRCSPTCCPGTTRPPGRPVCQVCLDNGRSGEQACSPSTARNHGQHGQGAPRSATSAASRRVRGSSPLTLTRRQRVSRGRRRGGRAAPPRRRRSGGAARSSARGRSGPPPTGRASPASGRSRTAPGTSPPGIPSPRR